MYRASKHAVKGFTDALCMELESAGAPVSVALKPGAIDTPYTRHAKNYLEVEPVNPPTIYAPETVPRAILHCAETPMRDVFVGCGGKGISVLGQYLPRMTDIIMERLFIGQQKSVSPPKPRAHNALDRPFERLGYIKTGWKGKAM